MQFPNSKNPTSLKHRGTEDTEVFILPDPFFLLLSSASSFPLYFRSFLNPPSPASPRSPASSQYAVQCAGPESAAGRRHGCASTDRLSADSAERETSLLPGCASPRKFRRWPAACPPGKAGRRPVDENRRGRR